MTEVNISEQVKSIIMQLKCNFTLRGQPVPIEQVVSPTGLLPGFVRRADQLCSFCLGHGLGASFEDQQGSTLGIRVKFDDVTPNSLRLLCITDIIIEMIQQGPDRSITPLDDLLYD